MLIRRKSFLALGAASASAALLAACGGSDDTAAGGTSGGTGASDAGGASDGGGEGGAPARANADLVIWADEKKAQSLQEPAKAWADANGVTVAVQTVANDLQAAFITANQNGNGPDIVLGAHDWIGNLVQNGAISPVQLPADASTALAPIALKAVTFNGQTYGVPYAVETLALFANNALTDVPEPKTIEELIEAGKAKGAENVLALPVGEEGDAYHMQPLYTSGGGYLFGQDADGNHDPKDLGVGKEGSIAAGEKIKELGEQGVLKTSIDGTNAISLFTDGKAAYLVSGPWALADIEKAGMDVTLSAVPGFEGMQPAKPFAGVNAFYVASQGQNAAFAQQFVNEVATAPEIPEAMFAVNQLPPAHAALQQSLAGDNPEIVQIAEFAEGADPMPSIPEMAAIWGPLGKAQSSIVGGADPASTMQAAGEEIASQIG
ncbi:extracellular solute-binding protein [Brachybacterium sp. EF45031]|uniref:sugar ABC transporter substrate-binding protein n=1 Tax=Brachybacterium sillae TaxID=2810536 RepID=UPI00217D058C|nr:extracellular solute-binding protein [Brachybacterium sillae]MCS6712546.1 extracellular solute-binding protein [Brachybacterium sillae]